MGKRQLSFGERARQDMIRRREIDTFLQSVEKSAYENPVEASSHLYQTALYWRRVWRRQYRRLARKAKRRLLANGNEYVEFVAVECSEPHGARRVLYAAWKFTLWHYALCNMLDAALVAESLDENPHRWPAKDFSLHIWTHMSCYMRLLGLSGWEPNCEKR